MFPLMMLLAFMLSLLMTSAQILNATDLYTLFPSNPVGDVLNVTQCYCRNPGPLTFNTTFGYYYLFDYWNYHLNRTYSISVNCTSAVSDDAISTKPDKCLDNIRKQKKLCVDHSDGNKFCYKFKEDVDNVDHSKPSASKYGFNGQKRGVPEHASDIMTLYNVTQNCGYYCSEKLGGLLTSQTPESSILGVGKVANSIVSYTDLDDMCYTCV